MTESRRFLAVGFLAFAGICFAQTEPYAVIDLSGGPLATSYPVSYAAVTDNGWTNGLTYKTTKLVLRRIEQPGVGGTNYIGVFEVTKGQWNQVIGSSFIPVDFPMDSRTYAVMNAFITTLRTKTGLNVSFPSESQWEFACRAGTTTDYHYGSDSATPLPNYAWFQDNSGGASHAVGLKLPNPWGIYDLYGNVSEICLGTPIPLRGGYYGDTASACTSASRSTNFSGSSPQVGFRILANVPLLTVIGGTGGGYYTNGTVVSVSTNATSHQNFVKWLVDPVGTYLGAGFASNSASTTVTMPFVDVTLTASNTPVMYTLAVTDGTGSGTAYTNGEVVAIMANTPPAGQIFDRWTGDTNDVANVLAASTTITIHGSAAVTATYKNTPYTLTVYSGQSTNVSQHASGETVAIAADAPPSDQMFDAWQKSITVDLGSNFDPFSASTELIMPPDDLIMTATFKPIPKYTLTVVSGTGSGSYTNGELVAVKADTKEGETLTYWEVSPAGIDLGVGFASNSVETTLIMPSNSVTITAHYKIVLYPLNVINGSGDGDYPFGTPVTVKADAVQEHIFSYWAVTPAGTDLGVGFISTSIQTTVIMPTKAVTLTANYLVPLNVINGSGSGCYTNGQVVQISADPPESGYIFERWSGDTNTVNDVFASSTTLVMPSTRVAVAATYTHHPLTYYVNVARVDDSGAGTSWETAKKTLQAAVDVALEGDSVIVTNGVYSSISTGNKMVTIRSVNGAQVTVLDGGRTNRCATLGDWHVTNSVLVGFTLRNGYADLGGGAYYGTLYNCIISGNTAEEMGGGAYEGTLNNCTLYGNLAHIGGGISFGTLNNCTLYNNMADECGGAYEGALNNCIVWANLGRHGILDNYFGGTFGYSCTIPLPSGDGNTEGDPVFVDIQGGDVRLRAGSPCVDAGSIGYVAGETDILGNPRVQNGEVDMGAYEGGVVGHVIAVRVLGHGRVSPAEPQVVNNGGEVRFAAETGSAVLLRFLTNGMFASTSPTFTWSNITSDGTLTAVFDSVCWFVDVTRPDDSGDGLSWAMAKRTIQSAIDAATNGDSILVADGEYKEGGGTTPLSRGLSNRVVITKAITLKSVNGPSKTFIEGSGTNQFNTAAACRCIYMTGGVVDGFTLRYGTTLSGFDRGLIKKRKSSCGGGGGVLLEGAALCPEVRNCVIKECMSNAGGGACGGLLNNCTIENNVAELWGGGVSECVLNSCILTWNFAVNGGGSFYSTLDNCKLSDNKALNEGGGSSECMLNNCLLVGNVSESTGGGSCSRFGFGSMNNCTLVKNVAGSNGGGANGGYLRNCIIWGNHAPQDNDVSAYYWDGGLLKPIFYWSITHCCVSPFQPESAMTVFGGDANIITSDPLFENPSNSVYQLSEQSPCINTGTNALVSGTTDLDGKARIIFGTVDMGAYEAFPLGIALSSSNLVWSTGGDAYWFGQLAATPEGGSAVQSGPIGDNEGVWIQAAAEGKGTLRFTWRVSSESWDYLRFYADGQPGGAISGTTTWQTVTFAVTNTGKHEFRWEYRKGKSGVAGEDNGWLAQVDWIPVMTAVTVDVSPAEGGTVTGGGKYLSGSSITLVARPNRDFGWSFERWENGATNATRVLEVPEGACACTAYFIHNAIPLSDALETTALTWATDGDVAWLGWLLASAHDGDDAAQSGTVEDLGLSSVATVVSGPGSLSFWWKASCEEGYDYLDFSLNGVVSTWLTGESGWQQVFLTVGAGSHAFEWTYWKDESFSGGEDAAWLDQVVWTPSQTSTPVPVPFAWLDQYPVLLGLAGGDYEAAALADVDGDGHAAWQEYVTGSVPTNRESVFRTLMTVSNGMPWFTWAPNLGTSRIYTVTGKTNLTAGAWGPTNVSSRFFRVGVDMP